MAYKLNLIFFKGTPNPNCDFTLILMIHAHVFSAGASNLRSLPSVMDSGSWYVKISGLSVAREGG